MKKYIPNTILKPFWLEKSLETIILFSLLIIVKYLLNHYGFEQTILWSDILFTIIIYGKSWILLQNMAYMTELKK